MSSHCKTWIAFPVAHIFSYFWVFFAISLPHLLHQVKYHRRLVEFVILFNIFLHLCKTWYFLAPSDCEEFKFLGNCKNDTDEFQLCHANAWINATFTIFHGQIPEYDTFSKICRFDICTGKVILFIQLSVFYLLSVDMPN